MNFAVDRKYTSLNMWNMQSGWDFMQKWLIASVKWVPSKNR
jgi:hypothetical protein